MLRCLVMRFPMGAARPLSFRLLSCWVGAVFFALLATMYAAGSERKAQTPQGGSTGTQDEPDWVTAMLAEEEEGRGGGGGRVGGGRWCGLVGLVLGDEQAGSRKCTLHTAARDAKDRFTSPCAQAGGQAGSQVVRLVRRCARAGFFARRTVGVQRAGPLLVQACFATWPARSTLSVSCASAASHGSSSTRPPNAPLQTRPPARPSALLSILCARYSAPSHMYRRSDRRKRDRPRDQRARARMGTVRPAP